MLFNSINFLIFFILVFGLYWFAFKNKTKAQNILLLIASYIFYAFWDWRFVSLIFISSLSDFLIGQALDKSNNTKTRKHWVALSMAINLSILGFFKYYNFFIGSLIELCSTLNIPFNAHILHIILPVGISFYTFQTMSYTLDIYRNQLKPSKNFVNFFAFVSFFPQLVAGPIERAKNLLPQFEKQRTFDYSKAADGLRQTLWGLFQKVVIADNCAGFVQQAFSNPSEQSASFLIIGAFLFAIQVYGDFAGYSNMAIGISRILGFDLMQNFNSPYFSQNITEIWRRWHISLSTWLRDYLFTPLALTTRNWGIWSIIFSTIITFTISGLWHGANWNFIFWGFLHGIALSYEVLTKKTRKKWKKKLPKVLYVNVSIALTFLVWTLGLIFFRSANTNSGFLYFQSLLANDFDLMNLPEQSKLATLFLLIFGFLAVDRWGKDTKYAIEKIGLWKKASWRWLVYFILIFLILAFYPTQETPFIYFQF